MNRSAIELHIERLVLSGFESNDAPVIGAALRDELARLLAMPQTGGAMMENRELSRIDAGSVSIGLDRPVDTGRQVARAVYRGMGR